MSENYYFVILYHIITKRINKIPECRIIVIPTIYCHKKKTTIAVYNIRNIILHIIY